MDDVFGSFLKMFSQRFGCATASNRGVLQVCAKGEKFLDGRRDRNQRKCS